MTPTQRTAAYLRVSSEAQAKDDRLGLAHQRQEIQRYASSQNLEVSSWFQDEMTGTKASRTALNKLLEQGGYYEVVLISSVDRLARRVGIAYGVKDELLEAGFALHSADMGPINDEDVSSLNFGVRALFADQAHRELTRKLASHRRAKVLERGIPMVPVWKFGWDKGKHHPENSEWVRWMYAQALEMGGHRIARGLMDRGVLTPKGGTYWHKETIIEILRDPLYRGEYRYGRNKNAKGTKVVITAPVEPIISSELWWAVQRALDLRRGGQGKPSSHPELSLIGRIYCGHCGRAMTWRTAKGGFSEGGLELSILYYYKCAGYAKPKDYPTYCDHKTGYRIEAMHGAVQGALLEFSTNQPLLERALPHRAAPVSSTQDAQRAQILKRLERARAAYLAEVDDLETYSASKRILERQLEQLETEHEAPVLLPAQSPTVARQKLLEALSEDVDLKALGLRLGLRVEVFGREDIRVMLEPM